MAHAAAICAKTQIMLLTLGEPVDDVLKWIILQPVALVHNTRLVPEDDNWGDVISTIELLPEFPAESLDGLDAFSHVEIIYFFHQVPAAKVGSAARHPRNNPAWPKVGIFAQRGKNRPNRVGATIARVLRLEGRALIVAGLDAIDGTPVLDIKPVMCEFLPQGDVRQPEWVRELMADYWSKPSPA
jgi:tRNA (adenine37-N6)-methyltransferase